MTTSFQNYHRNKPGGGPSWGILGIAGDLVEFKHGLPAIFGPFLNCHSGWDVVATLQNMDDGQFIGIVLWCALLLASLWATIKGVTALFGHSTRTGSRRLS